METIAPSPGMSDQTRTMILALNRVRACKSIYSRARNRAKGMMAYASRVGTDNARARAWSSIAEMHALASDLAEAREALNAK